MRRFFKQFMLLAALTGFTSAASAALLLDLLQPGATLQQGDKIFSNFTWTGPTGPAGFTVKGIGDGSAGNLYGIELAGPLAQVGPGLSDWRFGYSVTVAPGYQALISDVHQYANLDGTAGAYVNISEDVLNAQAGTVVATSHLGQGVNYAYIDRNDPPAELNDTLTLTTPLKTIWVKKDIMLVAQGSSDYALTSIIDQRFSQVPEPTTAIAGVLALLPVGFGAFRLRRK